MRRRSPTRRCRCWRTAVARVGKIDQAAIGADFPRQYILHRHRRPEVRRESASGREERNLYVQYQGVTGNDLEQFKKAGTQVILYPEKYRSGKLRTPFPAAS